MLRNGGQANRGIGCCCCLFVCFFLGGEDDVRTSYFPTALLATLAILLSLPPSSATSRGVPAPLNWVSVPLSFEYDS